MTQRTTSQVALPIVDTYLCPITAPRCTLLGQRADGVQSAEGKCSMSWLYLLDARWAWQNCCTPACSLLNLIDAALQSQHAACIRDRGMPVLHPDAQWSPADGMLDGGSAVRVAPST